MNQIAVCGLCSMKSFPNNWSIALFVMLWCNSLFCTVHYQCTVIMMYILCFSQISPQSWTLFTCANFPYFVSFFSLLSLPPLKKKKNAVVTKCLICISFLGNISVPFSLFHTYSHYTQKQKITLITHRNRRHFSTLFTPICCLSVWISQSFFFVQIKGHQLRIHTLLDYWLKNKLIHTQWPHSSDSMPKTLLD